MSLALDISLRINYSDKMVVMRVLLAAVLLFGASAQVAVPCDMTVSCVDRFVCENKVCKIPSSGQCNKEQVSPTMPPTGTSPAADRTTHLTVPESTFHTEEYSSWSSSTTAMFPRPRPLRPSSRLRRQAAINECVANALCLSQVDGRLTCSCLQGHFADSEGFCQQVNAADSKRKFNNWTIVFGTVYLLLMK